MSREFGPKYSSIGRRYDEPTKDTTVIMDIFNWWGDFAQKNPAQAEALLAKDGLIQIASSRGDPANPMVAVNEAYEAAVAKPSDDLRVNDGPLAVLDKERLTAGFDLRLLEYPLNISRDPNFMHIMKISIFKPETSFFNITKTENVTPTASSQNRVNFGTNIANPDTVLTEATIGTIIGAQTFGNAFAAGARAGAATTPVTAAIAGVESGVIGAILTTVLEKNIDMKRDAKQLAQNIYLYAPQQVIFTQQHKYSEVSATAALGALGYVSQGGQTIQGGGAGGIEGFKNLLARVKEAGEGPFGQELKNMLVGNAAQKLGIIGEKAQDLLLQSQGYAQNPQMEVLFDTSDFRQFTFEFDFMPRNRDETIQVMQIIEKLRFYSAPELYRTKSGDVRGGGRYFIPPYYFEIEFMQKNGNGIVPNPNIPKITTCVLEQIDVDYVGDSDRFVSHWDGSPVHTKLTLRFKEVEIIHKELVLKGY